MAKVFVSREKELGQPTRGRHVEFADEAEPAAKAPYTGLRLRVDGSMRMIPPPALAKVATVVRKDAPVDVGFREWVTATTGSDPSSTGLASTSSGFARNRGCRGRGMRRSST